MFDQRTSGGHGISYRKVHRDEDRVIDIKTRMPTLEETRLCHWCVTGWPVFQWDKDFWHDGPNHEKLWCAAHPAATDEDSKMVHYRDEDCDAYGNLPNADALAEDKPTEPTGDEAVDWDAVDECLNGGAEDEAKIINITMAYAYDALASLIDCELDPKDDPDHRVSFTDEEAKILKDALQIAAATLRAR
jgi:hypothetical protein